MQQTKKLRDRAIRVEQLPEIVSRKLASDFALSSTRFLLREEKAGKLKPIIVGGTVHYKKKNLLKFLGIDDPS